MRPSEATPGEPRGPPRRVPRLHRHAGGGDAIFPPSSRDSLRPWLCGHGAPPRGLHTVESWTDEVDRLEGLFRRHGLTDVHLVGYSLGARLALGLALRHPARVHRLTLIGVNPGIEEEEVRVLRDSWETELVETLMELGLDAFVKQWEALPLFDSQRRLPDAVVATQRAARRSHTAEGLIHSLRMTGVTAMGSLWPGLLTSRMPLRLLVGGDDPRFLAIAERIAAGRPGTEVQVIPGAGHNTLLEAPAATVAAALAP